MKFNEQQLEQIARYQESRGVTRAAALKACKRAWSKGATPEVRMVHMAAAAPALAPVENNEIELTTSAAEAREDAKAKPVAKKAATPARRHEDQPKPEKLYKASHPKAKSGFVLEFIEFVQKKGEVTKAELVEKFVGRQIDGHKVNEVRIARYLSWFVANDYLKVSGTRKGK